MNRRFLVGLVALQLLSLQAIQAAASVQAAVVRSQGTGNPSRMIWQELNATWQDFGNVPVTIDYTSLAGADLTPAMIQATDADVLILSVPGPVYTFTDSEMDAITDYVRAGHGLIFTYVDFLGNKQRLAPLLGLSESITLTAGTSTGTFDNVSVFPSEHPLFARISEPYVSGVPYMAHIDPWPITTGRSVAEVWGDGYRHGIIVANDTSTYRGLYFPHYIENKEAGSNENDMQLFYNGIVWTANVVPEPASLAVWSLLSIVGIGCCWRSRISRMTRFSNSSSSGNIAREGCPRN